MPMQRGPRSRSQHAQHGQHGGPCAPSPPWQWPSPRGQTPLLRHTHSGSRGDAAPPAGKERQAALRRCACLGSASAIAVPGQAAATAPLVSRGGGFGSDNFRRMTGGTSAAAAAAAAVRQKRGHSKQGGREGLGLAASQHALGCRRERQAVPARRCSPSKRHAPACPRCWPLPRCIAVRPSPACAQRAPACTHPQDPLT